MPCMLFQRYGDSLTVGQIREYLKDYPDHAPVKLDGGDDFTDGHELYTIKPKEFYMLSQDSLSRRLGPVFAEVAAREAWAFVPTAVMPSKAPKRASKGWKIPIPCQPLPRHTSPAMEATPG